MGAVTNFWDNERTTGYREHKTKNRIRLEISHTTNSIHDSTHIVEQIRTCVPEAGVKGGDR